MVRRALLLLALCCAAPAHAGLFSDDDARQQIKELEARVAKLESSSTQQVSSLLELSSQIDALKAELRTLRGQNEELARGLQDAEKREKDFYVDLDTRLRHFETAEQEAAAKPAPSADPNDPVAENRAYEAAYTLYKGGHHDDAVKAFQSFLGQYPASVQRPNALYWLGNAQFAMKSHKAALDTFNNLHEDFSSYARDPEVLLNIAACQGALKKKDDEKKTLKLLISTYPDSEAAAEAKTQLGSSKSSSKSSKKK